MNPQRQDRSPRHSAAPGTADAPDDWLETRRAELAVEQGDPAAAIPRLEAVLRREQNFAPALAALAQACWLAGHPAEGLAHARRAVSIQPPNPHFRLVLAQLCMWLGETEEARSQLATVLGIPILDPRVRARTLALRAEWHIARGEFAEANEAFPTALALAPDSAQTHMAYGINLLRLGMFAAGWPEYAWHAHVPSRRGSIHPDLQRLAGRRWNGEPLQGRRILLWDDQGLGDAIQFFRYLPLLRNAGADRISQCTFASLLPLFRPAAPFADFATEPSLLSASDYHCATSDLPAAFRTQLDTIPAAVPYLAAPRRPRLPRDRRPHVGLVWSGDPHHLRDHLRSIPAADFLGIAEAPHLAFHSLQCPVRPHDAAALAARPFISRIGDTLRNFAETAAAVQQLDLLITVDTSVAHLAGALGRPVWILLPHVADWRWLTGRDDSPWYPSARLFRSGPNGWTPVLRQVTEALRVNSFRRA